MFYGCSKLTNLNVEGWNTSKVTNMYYMFDSFSGSLSLSGWDFSALSSYYYSPFYYNSKIKSLDLTNTKFA